MALREPCDALEVLLTDASLTEQIGCFSRSEGVEPNRAEGGRRIGIGEPGERGRVAPSHDYAHRLRQGRHKDLPEPCVEETKYFIRVEDDDGSSALRGRLRCGLIKGIEREAQYGSKLGEEPEFRGLNATAIDAVHGRSPFGRSQPERIE